MNVISETSRVYAEAHSHMDPTMIYRRPYMEVMTAVAAFDATDAGQDNMLSTAEIKYLVYVYEQREITEKEVQEIA